MSDALLITPVMPDPRGDGRAKRAHQWLTELSATATVSVIVVRSLAAAPNFLFAAGGEVDGVVVREIVVCSSLWMRTLRILGAFLPTPASRFGRPLEWVSCRGRLRRKLKAWRAEAGSRRFARILCFRLYLSEVALAVAHIEKRRTGVSPLLELDLDDIESETNRELAALAFSDGDLRRAALFAGSGRAYRSAERRWLPQFAHVTVCCSEDKAAIGRRFGALRTRIVPNRLFAPLVPAETGLRGNPQSDLRALFVGTLGYLANSQAALWFAAEVLPLLRQFDSRWTFLVAGFSAPRALRHRLERMAGVELLSPASRIEDCYRRSRVVVAPLRAGGGTKIKAIEALAHACPLVATDKAVRGLGVADGIHYWRAHSSEEFATACMALADDPARAAALGERGRSYLQADFLYGRTTTGRLSLPA
ncbi:MAG TPA: glycosyltransferase family 4 protein [Stellaceae bacterium]|nr:glycosyltransferase family 4 protein [Stellaceae bacterium]